VLDGAKSWVCRTRSKRVAEWREDAQNWSVTKRTITPVPHIHIPEGHICALCTQLFLCRYL
jgi:hypothetical protein